MSDFDDYYRDIAVPALKERNGTAVTYTSEDGTATAATALLGDEFVDEQEDERGRTQQRILEATLFKDQVAGVSLTATVTIDGEVWAVEKILGETPGDAVLRLVRDETVEVSGPDYRTR